MLSNSSPRRSCAYSECALLLQLLLSRRCECFHFQHPPAGRRTGGNASARKTVESIFALKLLAPAPPTEKWEKVMRELNNIVIICNEPHFAISAETFERDNVAAATRDLWCSKRNVETACALGSSSLRPFSPPLAKAFLFCTVLKNIEFASFKTGFRCILLVLQFSLRHLLVDIHLEAAKTLGSAFGVFLFSESKHRKGDILLHTLSDCFCSAVFALRGERMRGENGASRVKLCYCYASISFCGFRFSRQRKIDPIRTTVFASCFQPFGIDFAFVHALEFTQSRLQIYLRILVNLFAREPPLRGSPGATLFISHAKNSPSLFSAQRMPPSAGMSPVLFSELSGCSTARRRDCFLSALHWPASRARRRSRAMENRVKRLQRDKFHSTEAACLRRRSTITTC